VADAKVDLKILDDDKLKNMLPQPALKALLAKKPSQSKHLLMKINLAHTAERGIAVILNFENEESAGTRRFFAIVGPWLDILENGYTAFIDEIETSLHPILVRELLKLLFSPKHNSKGAQIIFTTHNPLLLDTTLMRRDQIWFTEKTPAGATELYPLTDFQPRKDELVAKGYLAGRYGAIPYIPQGLKL
jgi:AAA15 family ATPase/GTPase